MLLIAGDDHACKSSTVPHQSEPALIAALVPVLVPANVHDIIELGLHGWAMSRYSGLYTGFKTVADVVETSTSIHFDLGEFSIRYPNGERLALNISNQIFEGEQVRVSDDERPASGLPTRAR